MPHSPRAELRGALLDQLQAAAVDEPPLIATDYPLGTAGITVDLAVAAEEFIGFVIHVGGEPLDMLESKLAVCARYFHRLVVVVRAVDSDELDIDLAGAAIWAIDETGGLNEQSAGRAHLVSAAAFLDLMPPEHRAALIRPAISGAPDYDRTSAPLTEQQVTSHFEHGFGRPPQLYWSRAWS